MHMFHVIMFATNNTCPVVHLPKMWKFGLEASMSEFSCSPLQVTDSSRVCLPLNFDSEFSSPLLARLRLADYRPQGLTSHAVSVRFQTGPHLVNHGA